MTVSWQRPETRRKAQEKKSRLQPDHLVPLAHGERLARLAAAGADGLAAARTGTASRGCGDMGSARAGRPHGILSGGPEPAPKVRGLGLCNAQRGRTLLGKQTLGVAFCAAFLLCVVS